MTDKLEFLEGEKKGKASSQDPKKAVNKKGWVHLLSIQSWKLVCGVFNLFSLPHFKGSASVDQSAERPPTLDLQPRSAMTAVWLWRRRFTQIYFWADFLVWQMSTQ